MFSSTSIVFTDAIQKKERVIYRFPSQRTACRSYSVQARPDKNDGTKAASTVCCVCPRSCSPTAGFALPATCQPRSGPYYSGPTCTFRTGTLQRNCSSPCGDRLVGRRVSQLGWPLACVLHCRPGSMHIDPPGGHVDCTRWSNAAHVVRATNIHDCSLRDSHISLSCCMQAEPEELATYFFVISRCAMGQHRLHLPSQPPTPPFTFFRTTRPSTQALHLVPHP